jgi:hypothetical protein
MQRYGMQRRKHLRTLREKHLHDTISRRAHSVRRELAELLHNDFSVRAFSILREREDV